MRPFSTRSDQLDGGPAFFVPLDGGDLSAQSAEYERLREAAEAEAQRIPHTRQIYSMQCRLHGQDCTVRVGERVPGEDHVVSAIFDVGGDDRYFVYGEGSLRGPLLRLGKKSVYEVMEFARP